MDRIHELAMHEVLSSVEEVGPPAMSWPSKTSRELANLRNIQSATSTSVTASQSEHLLSF